MGIDPPPTTQVKLCVVVVQVSREQQHNRDKSYKTKIEFGQNRFPTNKNSDPNFCGSKKIWPKFCFWIFLLPNLPKFFWPKKFPSQLFWPKQYFRPNFFWPQKNSDPNFCRPKKFPPNIFLTQKKVQINFLGGLKKIWPKFLKILK